MADRNNHPASTSPFPRRALLAAGALPLAFLLFTGGWMALAPLNSAIVAPGVVVVETSRKKIQHLEGGIVDEIRVRDGDRVARGDILVVLKDVRERAHVERVKAQYIEALAAVARLKAERDRAEAIDFGPELADRLADPVAVSAMDGQRRMFAARRELIEKTISVADKKIAQLQEEQSGLQGQIAALAAQAEAVNEEYESAAGLYRRKLMRKSRYLSIKRRRAALEKERVALTSKLAETAQKVLELELRRSKTRAAQLSEVITALQDQAALAYRLARELVAAEDRLHRTRIRTPIDGTIVGVNIHARDGVIAGGDVLMEVVPARDDLVIEARIRPEDIESAVPGLSTRVVLQTPRRRFGQPLRGTLEQVSADRLVDGASGRPYYSGRVVLERVSVGATPTKLRAGMGAEVFIQTGERTVISYLIAPIVKSFNRGLREP